MKNLEPDRISKLEAELSAIELWDGEYFEAKVHDKTTSDSFRARKGRREEILAEIIRKVGAADPRFPPQLS
jgi:hypothetical protein